jgi:TRAP transporter TAXI family solute receptor
MKISRSFVSTVATASSFVVLPVMTAYAVDLNFGSGRQGGSQYPVTVAMSQVLEKVPGIGKVSLQPGGSIGNIIRVDTGKSDIAISMSISLRDGRAGNAPFKKKTSNAVQLMTLHAFNVMALVPADSPIKSFRDFAGKKINFAPKGYSITHVGFRILEKLGIKGKVKVGYLRIGGAIQAFKDGHIDGLLYAPSNRYGPIINLAQTRTIRAVQLDKKIMDDMVNENPSFFKTTWPKSKGIYKRLVNKVTNIAYPNIILANKKRISNSQAYAMVKAIAENFDKVRVGDPSLNDFQPKDMARNVGSPFHAGAVRYYKERGWVK